MSERLYLFKKYSKASALYGVTILERIISFAGEAKGRGWRGMTRGRKSK